MEETSPDQGARPETAPSEEKKRPWGKIAAIVIVLIVIIAAIAAWRLLPTANRAPEITQSTASTEVARLTSSKTTYCQKSSLGWN